MRLGPLLCKTAFAFALAAVCSVLFFFLKKKIVQWQPRSKYMPTKGKWFINLVWSKSIKFTRADNGAGRLGFQGRQEKVFVELFPLARRVLLPVRLGSMTWPYSITTLTSPASASEKSAQRSRYMYLLLGRWRSSLTFAERARNGHHDLSLTHAHRDRAIRKQKVCQKMNDCQNWTTAGQQSPHLR